MIKKLFIFIIFISIVGCKGTGKQIRLFFNPSHSQNLKKIYFSAKLNEKTIIDTIISNNYIDKSHILKTFHLDNKSNNILTLKINNKIRIIKISDSHKDCVDVFSFYDDHSLIYKIASEIEGKKIDNGLDVDFKQVVDSLKKASKIDFYDKIEVNIKTMSCQE